MSLNVDIVKAKLTAQQNLGAKVNIPDKYVGPPGPAGKDGKDGESGVYIGTEPPVSEDINVWINPDGEATLPGGDVDLSNYYTKSEVDGKIAAVELTPGPQGPQGEPGKDGKDGAQGPQGEPGKDGVDGKDGAPGPKGDKGDDGAPGAKGDTGAQGIPGPKGDKGDQGIQGPAGANGQDYVITQADYDAIADVVWSKMVNASEVRY